MYCISCGAKIDDASRFCPFCGVRLAPYETQAPLQQSASPQHNAPQQYSAPPQQHNVPSQQSAPPQYGTSLQYNAPVRNKLPKGVKKRKAAVISVVAAVLVLAMGAGLLFGSGLLSGHPKGKSVKGVIGPENPRVGTDTLALDMGDFRLKSEAECTIKPVKAPAIEGAEVQAYEFSLNAGGEELPVMELTLPYDKEALDGENPLWNVGAAYYNEETKRWEPVPFTINDNGTLTIYTNHLSVYAGIKVKKGFTRMAEVVKLIPKDCYADSFKSSITYDEVIAEAVKNGGNPGESAVRKGAEIFENVMSFASAGTELLAAATEVESLPNLEKELLGTLPNYGIFSKLSKNLGDLGTFVSLLEINVDMYEYMQNGKGSSWSIFNDTLSTSTGYLAGKVGLPMFSVASLGVLAFDYSVNKFGEAAWETTEQKWSKAYREYYETNGERTKLGWLNEFRKARKGCASADRFRLRVEGLVKRYTDEYWNSGDYFTIADTAKTGFGALGGASEAVREKISQEYAKELYRGVLQDVFKQMAINDEIMAQVNLQKALDETMDELNRTCVLKLKDGTLDGKKKKSDVAGAKVFVALPEKIKDAEKWSAVLDERGQGEIRFSVMAFLMADKPDRLKLYAKGASESGEPTAVLSMASNAWKSLWSQEEKLYYYFAQEVDVGKKEYAWVLTKVEKESEREEITNDFRDIGGLKKEFKYKFSLSETKLSSLATMTSSGEESYEIRGTVEGIPKQIKPGETVKIKFSLTATESSENRQFGPIYDHDGRIFSYWTPGHASYALMNMNFKTEDGLQNYSVVIHVTSQTQLSETADTSVLMTEKGKKDGDSIRLYIESDAGKAYYVYTWQQVG